MTLRTTLLLLGAVALIAVYLYSRFGAGGPGSRNRRRLGRGRTGALAHWPWARQAPQDTLDVTDADPNDVTLQDAELPAVGLEDEESIEDDVRILPPVRRDDVEEPPAQAPRRDPPKRQQMELALTDAVPEASPSRAAAPDRTELLVLYLRASQARPISRNELAAAMDKTGMSLGDMRIYHHYGVGSVQGATPVFSVANMHEPGHLDVDDPQFPGYLGLSMFLQLPGPSDGPVAAELFLSTAQKLAQLLQLQIQSKDHRMLTTGDIDDLRTRAARFGATDGD